MIHAHVLHRPFATAGLLASLLLMGDAAQNSARFEQLFLWLWPFTASFWWCWGR